MEKGVSQPTTHKESIDTLTYEEALVSLICQLDTPIGRRKHSALVNECISIVRKQLEEDGTWKKYIKDIEGF